MTPNGGLSRARNLGLHAATGDIVAYLDDDARPDQDWLRYLARAFAASDHVGIGGPNIVPLDDPPFSQCVANAPGGPTHVLITDRLAEHIPGCNMAFRVQRLKEVGGFDEQFRIAGDDVDICWKLQSRGWTLGFHPAAVVWHHRRSSLKTYWRQQLNYGRAEAMLEVKWPEKYNAIGHIGWRGRLYGSGSCRGIGLLRSRVYQGVWATAAFQPLCARDSVADALPLMPEWYLIIAIIAAIGVLGLLWAPLLVCLPLAGVATLATIVQAARSASSACFRETSRRHRLTLYAVTTILHVIQPAARLWGRLAYGLTPWRRKMGRALVLPRPRGTAIWDECWQPAEQRLGSVEAMLKAQGVPVRRGGPFDTWDLEVRGGFFVSARSRLGVEEYPGGRQYLRFRVWPAFYKASIAVAVLPAVLATMAATQHAWVAAGVLGVLATVLALRALGDCAAATTCLLATLSRYGEQLHAARAPARQAPVTGSAKATRRDSISVRILTSNVARAPGPAASTPVTDTVDDGDVIEGVVVVGVGSNSS
jgi:O-antigen biosynthesis protein